MICGYNLQSLVKEIYLITENSINTQELIIDSNTPETTIANAFRLKTLTTNVTEETQKNGEKTEFIHQLTFRLYGLDRNLINVIKTYRFFGFKTEMGQLFIINPNIQIHPIYEVNLDENYNLVTSFTCAVKSNFPFVPIDSITNITDLQNWESCSYDIENVVSIEYNHRCYVTRNDSTIKHIEGKPFTKVDFLKGSVKYAEKYDGNTTTEELTFALPINEDMKHYAFVEHDPHNRWSFVLRLGSYFIPVGFNNGMVAGYTAEQNNDNGSVAMTFSDKYDCGIETDTYQSLTNTTVGGHDWKYIKDKSIFYADGLNQYVLQQKEDAFGNKLNEYKSFGNMSFDNYNIVGHFDTIKTYQYEYAQNPYYIDTNLTSMTFNKQNEEKTFYIKTNYSQWSLSSTNADITISPDNGSANELYSITITNGIDPEDGTENGTITLEITDSSFVEPQQMTFGFTVEKMYADTIFPKGTEFETDYTEKTIEIPFNCSITAVNGANAYLNGNNISVPLTENITALDRTFTIIATTDFGTYTLTVIQDGANRVWIVDGQQCDGTDLREILRLVIDGERTNETKLGNIIQSDYCSEYEIEDYETTDTYCDGTDEWYIVETRKSYDNFTTYEVINKSLGTWVSTCSETEQRYYVWELSDYLTSLWENGECYLYIKKYYYLNDPSTLYDVVDWETSVNGTNGELPIVYVE